MTLTITGRGAPAEAALPVDALALQLRLPDGWDAVAGRRAQLAARLRAALGTVEMASGRAVLAQEVTLTGRAPGGRRLVLPVAPVASVVSVAADGAAVTLAGAAWDGAAGRTHLVLSRALMAGAEVVVRVVAGAADWAGVPGPLAEAVLQDAEALETGAEMAVLTERLVAPFRGLRLRGAT